MYEAWKTHDRRHLDQGTVGIRTSVEKGWRRIGLIDPAEVPGKWPRRWAATA